MIPVLAAELRRGTAPAAALLAFVAGVWVLLAHPEQWSSRWSALAAYSRVSLLVLCPLMVTVGAWQAGRDTRRGIDELLATVARPRWQPLLVTFTAVSLGGTAGAVVAFAGAALPVGRTASHAGWQWGWAVAVGVLALWTGAALGFVVGRHVRLRVIAPVAGLTAYLGLAVGTYLPDRAAWLSPATAWSVPERLPPALHAWQGTWLLALAVVFLALAARRWRAASAAALLAVAAAVPLANGPRPRDLPVDVGAVTPVCTTAGPQVCVARIHAHLLDEVARAAQPLLLRLAGIPGAAHRAADDALRPRASRGPDRETVWLQLASQSTVAGTLADPEGVREEFASVLYTYCDPEPLQLDEQVEVTRTLARQWLLEPSTPSPAPDPVTGGDEAARLARLTALPPAGQRAWMAAYLGAAHTCDRARLVRLAAEP